MRKNIFNFFVMVGGCSLFLNGCVSDISNLSDNDSIIDESQKKPNTQKPSIKPDINNPNINNPEMDNQGNTDQNIEGNKPSEKPDTDGETNNGEIVTDFKLKVDGVKSSSVNIYFIPSQGMGCASIDIETVPFINNAKIDYELPPFLYNINGKICSYSPISATFSVTVNDKIRKTFNFNVYGQSFENVEPGEENFNNTGFSFQDNVIPMPYTYKKLKRGNNSINSNNKSIYSFVFSVPNPVNKTKNDIHDYADLIQLRSDSYNTNFKLSKELNSTLNTNVTNTRKDDITKEDIKKLITNESLVELNTNCSNKVVTNKITQYRNDDSVTWKQVSVNRATCKVSTKSTDFYLDDFYKDYIDIEDLKSIARNFESRKEAINKVFGNENQKGVNRIKVILTNFCPKHPIIFNPRNEKHDINNKKENIIFLNLKYAGRPMEHLDRFSMERSKAELITALIYMISNDNRHILTMPKWIDMGLALLGQYYVGNIDYHQRLVEFSLTYNQGNPLILDRLDEYGHILLFFKYLDHRFGNSFIKKIIGNPKRYNNSATIMEEALNMNFNLVYKDFIIAMLVSGRNITDDIRYEVPSFNENKFNLVQLIDANLKQKGNISNIDRSLKPYSFYFDKWNPNTKNIDTNFSNTGIIQPYGFYEFIENK